MMDSRSRQHPQLSLGGSAYHDYCQDLTKLAQQWSDLMKQDLPAVNAQLTGQHLQPLPETMLTGSVPACGQ